MGAAGPVNSEETETIDVMDRPSIWRRFRHQKIPMIALIYLVTLVLVAVFAPWIAPHDPFEQNFSDIAQGPSLTYLLGTDNFGRDILSRIIHGSRITFYTGLLAVSIGCIIGVPIGLITGYAGGRVDKVTMWINDVIFILPPFIIALAVVAIVGPNLTIAMAAVGFRSATRYIRLTRGVVLAEREKTYVEGAKLSGAPTSHILFKHIFPNVFSPLVVQTSLLFGVTILVEAGLSFIGVGASPEDPSWGRMLSEALYWIGQQPFMVVPPGLAITITVLAFNLLGDGLNDVMGRKVSASKISIYKTSGKKLKPLKEDVAQTGKKESQVKPYVSIRGLEVKFPSNKGDISVIQDVNLNIYPGETLGLIGESGSGKSMTAWALLNMVPFPGYISAGSIRLKGRELIGLSETQYRHIRGKEIGMIFQDPLSALDPVMTIGEQISEPLIHHEKMTKQHARERALELLKLVSVPEPEKRLDEYPHQFSGGMAQRAVIARALSCNPRILIADEPTTALDVSIQGEVLDLMRDLQEKIDMTMLFITHNLGVAADICHRGAVMYAGQIVEMGNIDDLVERPMHPYTAALLMAMPDNDKRTERLANIKGQVPQPWAWPQGCRFHPRCQKVCTECNPTLEAELREVKPGHWVRCSVPLNLKKGE